MIVHGSTVDIDNDRTPISVDDAGRERSVDIANDPTPKQGSTGIPNCER